MKKIKVRMQNKNVKFKITRFFGVVISFVMLLVFTGVDMAFASPMPPGYCDPGPCKSISDYKIVWVVIASLIFFLLLFLALKYLLRLKEGKSFILSILLIVLVNLLLWFFYPLNN